ncbi:hypothetical protein PO909_019956, partial [Leuciscus waleckii]
QYCNSVFTCLNKSALNKLQIVQNSAARLLTGAPRRSHITPVLLDLHWLPVKFRIDFKILVLTFRALNGQAPQYILDLLKPYSSDRTLRSSGQNLLVVQKKSIARLQYVQNSAARVLSSARRSHITPLLHGLHWQPVASRIHYKVLLLTFKALNGLAPQYLSDLLYPYHPARSLRSADLGLLSIPRFRLSTVGGRSFSVNAPQLWNSLPLTLRNTSSVATFKKDPVKNISI